MLHSFEYHPAAEAFVAAQKLDPNFAMAYWGEAMTFNHGVWNQVDAAAGKAALTKFGANAAARAARVSDGRERAYVAAVELLYEGSGTKVERDRRYARAMERLSASDPNDRNAQLFYALALISQSEGTRDVPAYLKAARVSEAIFRIEPNNPGAAHYWIHGMDDPEHAAGALEAARALSKIAPDASHAQHMCSHIFIALGMWDDVVQANEEAMRVDAAIDQSQGVPSSRCGHYAAWLEYGYFQQGRLQAAEKMVADCRQTNTEVTAWLAEHHGSLPYGAKSATQLQHHLQEAFSYMRDMAVIESRDWNGALKQSFDASGLTPEASAWHEFTNGVAAAQQGDLHAAGTALEAMRKKTEEVRADRDSDPDDVQALGVSDKSLSGLIKVKTGQYDAGVAEIRQACEIYRGMAFAFGPPVTIKPPEELLGEILLENKDRSAREWFVQALQKAPGRTQALLGLARAEQLASDGSAARKTYQKLTAIWHRADADVPGLDEVRRQASSGASR